MPPRFSVFTVISFFDFITVFPILETAVSRLTQPMKPVAIVRLDLAHGVAVSFPNFSPR